VKTLYSIITDGAFFYNAYNNQCTTQILEAEVYLTVNAQNVLNNIPKKTKRLHCWYVVDDIDNKGIDWFKGLGTKKDKTLVNMGKGDLQKAKIEKVTSYIQRKYRTVAYANKDLRTLAYELQPTLQDWLPTFVVKNKQTKQKQKQPDRQAQELNKVLNKINLNQETESAKSITSSAVNAFEENTVASTKEIETQITALKEADANSFAVESSIEETIHDISQKYDLDMGNVGVYQPIDWIVEWNRIEKLVDAVKQRKKQLELYLTKLEKRRIDVMHYAEFYVLNTQEGYNLYVLLRNIQLERRKVKNELIQLTVYMQKLKVLETTNKINIPTLEKRVYTPREMPDLFEAVKYDAESNSI
jgi:hypothetical protein